MRRPPQVPQCTSSRASFEPRSPDHQACVLPASVASTLGPTSSIGDGPPAWVGSKGEGKGMGLTTSKWEKYVVASAGDA